MTGKGSRRKLETRRLYASLVIKKQGWRVIGNPAASRGRFDCSAVPGERADDPVPQGLSAELAFCRDWAQEQISRFEA